MAKKFALFVFFLFLLMAAGCSDQDQEPYDDEGTDINWPTLDPDRYHWDGLSNPFSETWNWHIALPSDNASFEVTMGVFNPGSDDPDARGGLLRVASTELDSPVVLVSSVREFHGSIQIGDVTLGDNRGTQSIVRGHIDADTPVTFDFQVDIARGWENTMGVLTNIPLLPMNWHVNALVAKATGKIVVDGVEYRFENTPALEDHFWGTDYPGTTTRLVAWNFDDPNLALAEFAGQILLGPFELPNIMMAFQSPDFFYEFRSQDLNTLASVWRDEGGFYHIEATRGDARVHALVLNTDSEPITGLVFDEDGVGQGGNVWMNAVAVVKTYAKNESGDWQLISTETSTLATFSIGVSDPYQHLP